MRESIRVGVGKLKRFDERGGGGGRAGRVHVCIDPMPGPAIEPAEQKHASCGYAERKRSECGACRVGGGTRNGEGSKRRRLTF